MTGTVTIRAKGAPHASANRPVAREHRGTAITVASLLAPTLTGDPVEAGTVGKRLGSAFRRLPEQDRRDVCERESVRDALVDAVRRVCGATAHTVGYGTGWIATVALGSGRFGLQELRPTVLSVSAATF